MTITSGVKGAIANLFAMRRIRDMVGRVLLRWLQKTDFSIQYKLLLLVWKGSVMVDLLWLVVILHKKVE